MSCIYSKQFSEGTLIKAIVPYLKGTVEIKDNEEPRKSFYKGTLDHIPINLKSCAIYNIHAEDDVVVIII